MLSGILLAALASGASVDTERTYLSGRGCDDAVAWSFEIDKGPRAGVKTTIPVPSCWEMQGFGELQYGQYVRGLGKKWENVDPFAGTAVYRHTFAAPASSAGRHTDLRFEAVFTDCDVELNGVRLGSHQGGFYPFSFDVTGVLKATNELVVVVRDESSDKSVNFAERRGDYWNFGGIWRPVYLETKPLLHIRSVEVDAKADGTLDAVLHVSDGTTRTVHEKWENPRLWTAETPNLYEKSFELRDAEGRVVHRVVKKIGFRTIEARRGDCLRINGSRVTIKGINRHSFRPDTGRTLSYARNREDVMLIKSMNMNAVRCSHYPPDPEFLDLCDELGLYVDDELCGWQRAVGTKPGAPLVEAFVTRDQFHPSVIWWSNGNEGGFNFELDHLYRDFDLQKRPLLHPWDEFEAFHTKHYQNYEKTKAFLEGDWIYMPTEFQHGLHDGGHGAGLGELWALMMSSPRTAGGFLWDMRDQGVLRPDGTHDCYGVNGPDGILGPNGEKGGSVDAVREIWSPIVAKMVSCGADGASIEFENRYDFTDLSKCGFRWESLDFSGSGEAVLAGGRIEGVSAAPREKARADLPAAAAAGDALRVYMTGPGGEDVFTKVFTTGSARGVRSRGNGALPRVPAPRLVAFKGTEDRRQRFAPVDADFSWSATTNTDGSVEFAWTLSTTNAVDLLGVTFDIDESQVASKRWLGKGPYRVWRNRPEGPQLGVWENAYNDGYAGKSWEFPQFKGYFADTRWLELKMKDGSVMRFDVVEPSPYVGVFAPKDNEGNFLFQSPELGISVLEVCPATGDKFTAAKDVSPLGKSVVVPRVVSGRVSVAMMPTVAAEPAFGFRSRIADLHPSRRAADAAPVGADEVVVDARWSVATLSDDPTLRHAAADLSDFFAKSMGVKVVGGGKGRVEIGVDPSLPALQSKIEVSRGLIRVIGATPREAYQGCCRLEDELGRRGRPAAKIGVRTFTRTFSPRMTHSGWEVEKFPDVYLDQLVHSGMDAILVFIEDPPDVTRNGKVDMNALVERARLRGIDVYAYASFPVKASKFHPLDPGAEEWYDSTYGAIVKNAPGLKGIVCVGESVAFQARDGKTAGYWWGRPEDRVPGKRNNGWWPSMDWVPWLELVSKSTRRYNPDFEIVFWTYNWHFAPVEDRVALLEAVPTNVTVHVTFEMGDKPHYVDGVKKWISDYSIVGIGPSPTFRSEAEVCRRRGIRLTSMSNTGGRTWDSGVAPCEPCPYRWIDRFRALRGAQAEYGLCGLMECHHYGFMPNFISEIAKVAFTAETDASSLGRILAENAARDFGAANAEAVIETWKDWSEAFSYHSAYGQDQYGPLRLGPSYPLFLPSEDVPPPPNPHYSYYEGRRTGNGWRYLCSRYGIDKDMIVANRPHIDREIALWHRGNARLEALMPSVPAGKAATARRMLGLGLFFERTAETVRNVREFKIAQSAEERLAIVDREEANARAAIPLVEYDSSIGWEPTMGYVCDRAMLEWKIGKLQEMRLRLQKKQD